MPVAPSPEPGAPVNKNVLARLLSNERRYKFFTRRSSMVGKITVYGFCSVCRVEKKVKSDDLTVERRVEDDFFYRMMWEVKL